MTAATHQRYAVLTSKKVIGVANDEATAVRQARKHGRNVIVDRSVDLGRTIAQNPPLGRRGPELAWSGVQRIRVSASLAMNMTADEAYARVQQYLPQEKNGIALKAWATPRSTIQNLLGQNYKTSKTGLSDVQLNELRRRTGKESIDVQGLTMLPNIVWSRLLKTQLKINTCVGASRECAEACLVYSGRNEADPYNTVIKAAKLTCFIKEPNAFGALLYQACRAHLVSRSSYAGFVRLNVFSDIPWELCFPEIFEAIPGQFYDYTKVPSRTTPRNYDLTFSYSGRNYEDTLAELKRGRRVAVVFLTERHVLPATFLGYPVVDGDLSDARPLDPSPCIVGLAYKRPKKRGVKVSTADNVFVVPVHELDGQLVAAITPREQPGVAEGDAAENTAPRGTRLPVVQ